MRLSRLSRVLGQDEDVVLVLRRHAVVLLRPVLVLLLVVPVTVGLAGLAPQGTLQTAIRLAVLAGGGLIVVLTVIRPFLRWWSHVYVITTDRLLIREGVLHRYGHDVPLDRVVRVSCLRRVWQRPLGSGTLVLELLGEQGTLELVHVPQVELAQRAVCRPADQAWQHDPAGRVSTGRVSTGRVSTRALVPDRWSRDATARD